MGKPLEGKIILLMNADQILPNRGQSHIQKAITLLFNYSQLPFPLWIMGEQGRSKEKKKGKDITLSINTSLAEFSDILSK